MTWVIFVFIMIAEVAVIVWAAALLLAVRDRIRHANFPVPVPVEAEDSAELAPWPRWKLVLLAPLGIFFIPTAGAILLILVIPLFAWRAGFYTLCWLRFQTFGTPIPQIGHPEEPPRLP